MRNLKLSLHEVYSRLFIFNRPLSLSKTSISSPNIDSLQFADYFLVKTTVLTNRSFDSWSTCNKELRNWRLTRVSSRVDLLIFLSRKNKRTRTRLIVRKIRGVNYGERDDGLVSWNVSLVDGDIDQNFLDRLARWLYISANWILHSPHDTTRCTRVLIKSEVFTRLAADRIRERRE